jgi:DNA-binding transcriptional regulator PaaX
LTVNQAYAKIVDMDKYLLQIESFLKSDRAEAKATKIVLGVLAVSAFLGVALIAGNAIQLFETFKGSKRFNKRQINKTIDYLKRKKMIEFISSKNGQQIIKITKRGESHIRSFAIDTVEIKKVNKWNREWQVVIFDFPVRFKKSRNAFRYKLKQLGFIQIQKSVWVHPYKCEDEILFIADFWGVLRYVEVFTVTKMLHEQKLKKHFKLI